MIRGTVIPFLLLALCSLFLPTENPPHRNLVNFTFSHQRRSFSHLLKTIHKPTSLSVTVCLLLAGDIEINPGPPTVYLCALCDTEVTWSCKAICCDKCNIWIHHSCVNIDSIEYSLLGRTATPWHCPRCDNINCDTFTFNSFEISCYNSFAPLAQAKSAHEISHKSIDSVSELTDVFLPGCTSSPKSNPSLTRPSKISSKSSHHSTKSNEVFDLPKKSNLRILNMNCQSIRRKRTELHTSLEYIKPDIVCATETWLRGINPGKQPSTDTISSSEIFPSAFPVQILQPISYSDILLRKFSIKRNSFLTKSCQLFWKIK